MRKEINYQKIQEFVEKGFNSNFNPNSSAIRCGQNFLAIDL